MKLLSCLSQKDERPIRPEEEENKMKYEIMFIVKPNLEEAATKEVAKKFEKVLKAD